MPWVKDECEGCAVCVDSCPVDAIAMNDGQAEIDNFLCTRCGECFDACPLDMIRPNSENPALRGRNNRTGRGMGRGKGKGQGRGRRSGSQRRRDF